MKKMFGAVVSLAALTAFAQDFPDAVNGVITISSGTYDVALPATATKLIKTGTGEATLKAESSFDGTVEVQEGTLSISHRNALGTKSPIDVAAAATLHLNKPARPTGAGQTTCWFKNPITLHGAGVNGEGAFKYTYIDSSVCDDCAVSTLILAADATINVATRFGFGEKLDLAGHTLTRKGGSNWMFYSSNLKVTAGTIVNTTGTLTPQIAPTFVDADNTTLILTGGNLTPWNIGQPCPWNVTVRGGSLYPGSGGNNGKNNVLTGTFLLDIANSYFEIKPPAGKSLTFNGPVNLSTNKLTIGDAGKIFIGGPIVSQTNPRQYSCTLSQNGNNFVVLTGNVDRVIYSGYVGNVTSDNGCSKLWLTEGTLWTGMLRLGNGGGSARGAIWQTGGTYMNANWDTGYIGESRGTYGAYVLEGGTVSLSNALRIASSAGSQGLFVQKGGLVRAGSAALTGNPIFRVGNAGFGQLYVGGGTNDTYFANDGNALHVRMSTEGGLATVTVTGEKSLLKTDGLTMGTYNGTNAYTNVVNVMNGGQLDVCRFVRYPVAGSLAVVNVDGGILRPTFGSGWGSVDAWKDEAHVRDFDHFIVHSGGMVIDTSNTTGNDGKTPNTSGVTFHFDKPTGKRVKAIRLPTSDEFKKRIYGSPVNVVVEGAGYGATAFADFNFLTTNLTGIVVACGGCGYDENTKAYIYAPSINSPTLPIRYECTVELEDCPKGGAFTKRGAQTLDLYSRGCTYEGGTVVEEGTLIFRNTDGFPANTPLTVKKGATFDSNTHSVTVSELAGQGNISAGGITVTSALAVDASAFADGATPLAVAGNVTFADGATVNISLMPEELDVCKNLKMVKVLTATGTISGSPTLLVNGQPAEGWGLVRSGNALKVGWQHGLTVIVK